MAKRTLPLEKKEPPAVTLVKTRFKTEVRPPRQFFLQWRKYRGMTLERAAELSGMTAGNISAMERGTQGYSPEGLQALADVYRTNPGWLLEVNPLSEGFGEMWELWNRAKDRDKKAILSVAHSLVGKTA